MKLVKQVQLFFQEGSSDKVYEIDLCESGEGYVVNFRYGRRGSALKDGTKTIFPVSLDEAEKTFNSLEQEKRKKGYVALGEAQIDLTTEPKSKGPTDKRKKVIVKLLKASALGEEPENWPLSRIIWRAGDLKLSEAIPHIIELADWSDPFNIYSVIRAIGRCGTAKQLPFLKQLSKENLDKASQLLLQEVIFELTEDKEKEELIEAITESLPTVIKECIKAGNYKELNSQLRNYLFNLKTTSNDYLIALYRVLRQDPINIHFFLQIIQDIPLDINYFKYVRHIYKTSEMIGDYRMYAIIAHNIEKQPSKYHSGWLSSEDKKERAFSDKTKQYFIKRVQRTLKKFGEAGDLTYTAMGAEILLSYDDAVDSKKPYSTTFTTYSYNNETRRHTPIHTITHFDSYSKCNTFNYILYKNSTRYEPNKYEWKCVAPYTPGNPAPKGREEAFPQLWNQSPAETIKLLAYSRCLRVHEFAHKVFKANEEFEKHIENSHIISFFQSQFDITQQLGLDLARKIFNKQSPDKELIVAMLDCKLEEARKLASDWVLELKKILLADSDFVSKLLFMRTVDAHAWLRGLFTTSKFTKDQSDIITAKVFAFLISFEIQSEEDESYVIQIGDSLLLGFAESLQSINLNIVQDLFRHPSPVIHAIAGKILMKHQVRPEDLPGEFLQVLLQSEYVQTRNIGIELLGQFPDQLLLDKKEILVSFCISEKQDVRSAVKPLISKLVKTFPAFGEELVKLFLPAFLMKETYEGVHADLLSLLTTELVNSLHVIGQERTFTLLNSKFRMAQLLGAVLLKKNIQDQVLTIPELVKLSNNPLEEVRIYARNVFIKYPEKVKQQKEDAIRVTNSIWDDTRTFAYDYFRNTFTPADWNAELLICLCDSTREDVQDFGREMITKYSLQDDGIAYLLKLSQHPNTRLQLFTSSYLETYAGGNPEIIEKLKLYFITLLSQVNKGKVAKARAMDFLKKEALKDERIANIAAEIFTRISASVAITEKAACIEALRDIRSKHPTITSPIVVKEYSDYNA